MDGIHSGRSEDLFDFMKGKRLTKADMVPGNVNFLGAISENNGVREKIETDYCWNPNCITTLQLSNMCTLLLKPLFCGINNPY